MGKYDDLRKNASGKDDPTAFEAIVNLEREEKDDTYALKREKERLDKLMKVIFSICELAGFHVEGRITLKNVRSGRIWK